MLAGQIVVAGYSRDEGHEGVPQFFADALTKERLGGLVFFGRNLPEHAAHLFVHAELQKLKNVERALFAIDQEGGRVARLREGVIQLPPMRVLGATKNLEMVEVAAKVLGHHLAQLGITMNFSPVLDVDSNPDNPVIGDRAFSHETSEVIACGRAFSRGLKAGGVLPCGKHFPGHGDTHLDSHLALPIVKHDRARLAEIELAPFAALASELPAMMSAHVVFETFGKLPATLNREVSTRLLREEMGFEGALISDALEMRALDAFGSLEERAVLAVEAGCDVLLVCHSARAALAVVDALEKEARSSGAFHKRLNEAVERKRRLASLAGARPSFPAEPAETLDFSVPKALAAWLEEIRELATKQAQTDGPTDPAHDPTES